MSNPALDNLSEEYRDVFREIQKKYDGMRFECPDDFKVLAVVLDAVSLLAERGLLGGPCHSVGWKEYNNRENL